MVRIHSERGSEVLEAAIVLPMLIVLAFCLIQVCLIAYEGTAMSAAIESAAMKSDFSRCTEQEILDAVGFKMQQDLNSKAVKCKAGHQRLDAERTKTDLPKERKSPAR